MNTFNTTNRYPLNVFLRNSYLLDMKLGDGNGDGIIDKVSLYGSKPGGPTARFLNRY